jgi:hypothetical protein
VTQERIVVTQPNVVDNRPEPLVGWPALAAYFPQLLQLALAAAVVHLFAIEGPAFQRLFLLVVAGYALNIAMPLSMRLPFFVGLSLVATIVTLGVADAAWLVGTGLVLVALCHLPFPNRVRIAAVCTAGLALAAARGGLFGVPWSSAVWPILGSMFMFRIALYLYAGSRTVASAPGATAGPWPTLAYFFMLPNLTFPLFPVVDYQTFVRTYYDRESRTIYEQGLSWIARGLVHLLLYRLVYQLFTVDPVDVDSLGDLVQFMLSTFLLYLRVSGQFHLIVGILHMFGFRLPETHKLYYLATSFTEIWRRINIYWTEFMMKLVFYPTYFKIKHLGPTVALTIATAVVFMSTWLLHSYQWFWLRGGFPITLPDVLFWGALGGMVMFGALRDSQRSGGALGRRTGWSARKAMQTAATFGAFCLLWSLWSTESVAQWIWMLGSTARVDVKGVALLTATALLVGALGGRDWTAGPPEDAQWRRWVPQPALRTVVVLTLLTAIGLPAVSALIPKAGDEWLRALHATGLNAQDTAVQHRGYYEQLEIRATPNAEVADTVADRADWVEIISLGVLHERSDLLLLDLLPSKSVNWNGRMFSTNRWGMRDREYEVAKAPGTLRVALLGPSHVMGDNVPDGRTFEAVIEERLNREFKLDGYRRFEILNFAMPSYSSLQQVALLEERVFEFAPDVVLITHHASNRELTERALQRITAGNLKVPPPIETLFQEAGLVGAGHGKVPVPFVFARAAARQMGLAPRMPYAESAARIRRISDAVLNWSLRHFVDVTTARGAQPAILALNVALAQAPETIPNRAAIDALRVPLLDLFDVYPQDRILAMRVAPWDDHPNADAHGLIAERLYPMLTDLLSSLPTVTRSSLANGGL